MNTRSESGQILVLVLLVILIGMTIGLSVASRTLQTIDNQENLTSSNRAFSAAEAGIEQALLVIKNDGNCDNGACDPDIVGAETTVTSGIVGGNTNAYGIASLTQDEVFQLNLHDEVGNVQYMSGSGSKSVNIYWGNRDDYSAGACGQSAALVATLVYRNPAGEYGVAKRAYDPCNSDPGNASRSGSGFTTSVSSINPGDSITLQDGSSRSNYGYRQQLLLTGSGGMTAAANTLLSLRVKLMYVGQKPLAFAPPSGATLVVQGTQITSTSVVGGQQRTVKVLKSLDTVPAIFDYALFNGSTATLTK